MNIEQDLFKDTEPDYSKLIKYGFTKKGNSYLYETLIASNKFKVTITITKDSVMGIIIDLSTQEEYSGFRTTLNGVFASAIREEYLSVLNDIKNKCFLDNRKVNSWVIPANPKYFDVFAYFENSDVITWHQTIKAQVGDFAYIYMGSPYSALMFKCVVTKTNFLEGARVCMELKLLKEFAKDDYPLELLRKYELTSVRCERKMPDKLSDYLYNV